LLFTTFAYAALLLATFVAYWTLPEQGAWPALLLASLIFYAAWSVPFLVLLVASILVGYASSHTIARTSGTATDGPSGRRVLALTVFVLLGPLAFFKYSNLVLEAVAGATGRRLAPLALTLPLGISFYTFQILAYVIDVSRGASPEPSLLRFALFVLFFPHLNAGPIVRAHELLPQLRRRVPFDGERTISGLVLICYGLVKKAVVADNLAVLVDGVYGGPGDARGGDVLIATLAFGAQIYCDFSGYTDMARGSARLFGIELPFNFRSPYLAPRIDLFWRRWHITLSTWLRDYLYIPLGGNRVSPSRTRINLLVTMTLGGLWHGASLTFILWGFYHGVLLTVSRAVVGRQEPTDGMRRLIGVFVTFTFVQIGWAIFRARNLRTLFVLGGHVVADPLGTNPLFHATAFLPLCVAFYAAHALSATARARLPLEAPLLRPPLAATWLALATVLVAVFGGPSVSFIYFRF